MNSLSPSGYTPAILPANLSLFQVGELPQMVDGVQVAHLYEPGTHTLHNFSASLEAPTPMCLPLEQISGLKLVRPQLKETTQLSRRRGRPEAEFLHQRRLLFVDQGPELAVEVRKFGVLRDGIQGAMVTFVTLVLPDMDCNALLGFFYSSRLMECDVPNVSHSPTSVRQLPTRLTLFSGREAMRGYQLPTSSVYSSTLSGLTWWKTML